MKDIKLRPLTKGLLIALAVVLAAILFMSVSAGGASAAVVPAQTQTTGTSAGTVLSAHGTPIAVPLALATRSTTVAYCWTWTPSWHVWNYLGKDKYKFGISVEWCANSTKTKVTTLPYNYCLSQGGFYTFDWCKKQRGSFGYSYLGMYDNWHYHFIINGLTFTSTPSVTFNLHANGNIDGTVYYG
jgi:hypothetical protein